MPTFLLSSVPRFSPSSWNYILSINLSTLHVCFVFCQFKSTVKPLKQILSFSHFTFLFHDFHLVHFLKNDFYFFIETLIWCDIVTISSFTTSIVSSFISVNMSITATLKKLVSPTVSWLAFFPVHGSYFPVSLHGSYFFVVGNYTFQIIYHSTSGYWYASPLPAHVTVICLFICFVTNGLCQWSLFSHSVQLLLLFHREAQIWYIHSYPQLTGSPWLGGVLSSCLSLTTPSCETPIIAGWLLYCFQQCPGE